MKKFPRLSIISLAVISTFAQAESTQKLDEIQVTAEEQVKQSLGVSVVTAKDLERNPIENDASEIIAKQPGVTLSTNAPGGARGNKRQVDIRAMGPENTLILVDGKPVKSRNSERYGRNGTRNTRGDTTGYRRMPLNPLKCCVGRQQLVTVPARWVVWLILKPNLRPVSITAV